LQSSEKFEPAIFPLIILDYFVALLPAPVNISSWKYFINGGVYLNYLPKNTSTMQTI
jgi:hypothetical protein